MNFLRKYWFYLSGLLAIFIFLFLIFFGQNISPLKTILWISFVFLLFHQVEEYVFPGNFPRMLNKTFFKSTHPDKYPLNTQSALVINVFFAWSVYILAVLLADKFIFIAIASIIISLGNVLAHTFLFNIKGKTLYNPGMATAIILFLPISVYFFTYLKTFYPVQLFDYVVGIPLGILLTYFGIFPIINFVKDKKTNYIFPKRCIR